MAVTQTHEVAQETAMDGCSGAKERVESCTCGKQARSVRSNALGMISRAMVVVEMWINFD